MHSRACPMADVMLAHLAVIVGQAIRIRFGFREQQQAVVFVCVGRQQHNFGGLEILLAVA